MTVVFWNVENLFGDRPSFSQKTRAISKTLLMIADEEGGLPEVIAFAEVENERVLKKLKYNGAWEKIDGYFQRGLNVEERVFIAPHLLVEDKSFGGKKPFRAYSGPRYTGGVSDHLPIVLRIAEKNLVLTEFLESF